VIMPGRPPQTAVISPARNATYSPARGDSGDKSEGDDLGHHSD
jgi:hypothetical protein